MSQEGHSAQAHIGTTLALGANGGTFAGPIPGTKISTGVANDQSAALVTNRTATGATATTITDNTIVSVIDAYKGHVMVIVSGTGAGQTRMIKANTNAGAFTIEGAFATTPTGAVFSVFVPSTITPVLRGVALQHLTTAGGVLVTSSGLISGTYTTRTMAGYHSAAATAGGLTSSGGSFIGVPGGDLSMACTGALTGTCTCDAFWIGANAEVVPH